MTPASDRKPTTRRVVAESVRGPKGLRDARAFVVALGERTLTLRPLGCRANGPAAVTIPYAAIYERALMARALEAAKARKRSRRAR